LKKYGNKYRTWNDCACAKKGANGIENGIGVHHRPLIRPYTLCFTNLGGNMEQQNLLNIGFNSTVVADRVVAILSPNSSPMKRLKDEAKKDKRLIDATHGRRTRAIIIVDSNHIILSAIQAETISQRFATLEGPKKTV
jgi:regulator of extracellular matrix RemA (YlzA/DUF370 family)